MAAKFRKGQWVVCTHYKNRPVLLVDSVDSKNNELWVRDPSPRDLYSGYWYGPLNWFKRVRVK